MENTKIKLGAESAQAKAENLKQIKEINVAIADKLVKTNFKEDGSNAKEFVEKVSKDFKYGDAVDRNNALNKAIDFTKNLLLLCLYQNLEKPLVGGYITDIGDMFDAGMITEGNTKEYIASLITGSEQIDMADFVPKGATLPQELSTQIDMYIKDINGGTKLAPNSYIYKKPVTLLQERWISYFMSGKLSEYLANVAALQKDSYSLFKFNKVALLASQLKPTHKVVGTAENMFDAFATEIFPIIEDLRYFNSKYSFDNANYPFPSQLTQDRLIMVVPQKVLTKLKAGIQSQLYNAQFLDIKSMIDAGNIISLGDMFEYPEDDANKLIKCLDKPYLDDNTILFFDKELLQHLGQVNRNETQQYSNNLAIQLTLHIWGTFGIIPWKKMVSYTNPNLNVMPK